MIRTPLPNPLPNQSNSWPVQNSANPLPAQESSLTDQSNPPQNASHILDPTQQSCTLCSNFDTLGMVQCDGCKGWLHFACAGVTGEIAEKQVFCQRCTAEMADTTSRRKSDGQSGKSKTSNSSTARSAARRKQRLALERLEEERKLKEMRDKEYLKLKEMREKEYLDKKYETLEQLSLDFVNPASGNQYGLQLKPTNRQINASTGSGVNTTRTVCEFWCRQTKSSDRKN